MASFSPWTMLSPTVWGLRPRTVSFTVFWVVFFVVISDSLCLAGVPGYECRDQASHRVPLLPIEVRLPVFCVRGKQEHWQVLVAVVVDYSCATPLTRSLKRPPDLPNPIGPRNDFTGFRVCPYERHQFRPLRT